MCLVFFLTVPQWGRLSGSVDSLSSNTRQVFVLVSCAPSTHAAPGNQAGQQEGAGVKVGQQSKPVTIEPPSLSVENKEGSVGISLHCHLCGFVTQKLKPSKADQRLRSHQNSHHAKPAPPSSPSQEEHTQLVHPSLHHQEDHLQLVPPSSPNQDDQSQPITPSSPHQEDHSKPVPPSSASREILSRLSPIDDNSPITNHDAM